MREPSYTLTPVRDRLGRHAYQSFLETNPARDFMQTLEWGRVKALTGWRSLPLILQDQHGKVALSALVLVRRLPGLPISMFYAPRGPVLDWTRPADQLAMILRAFAASARKLACRHRAVVMKCDPALPAANAAAREAMAAAGFRPGTASLSFEGVQPRFVYAIDLDRPPEDLLASFSAKHRYNVRLAERKGVAVRRGVAQEDMAAFYRLLQVTAKRDGFGIRTYPYYQAIWQEMGSAGAATGVDTGAGVDAGTGAGAGTGADAVDGAAGGPGIAHLFLAEHQGELLSGALIFALGKRAWYVYGASGNRKRNLMPNYALHWRIMLWLRERGIAIYDMRGISGDFSPDHALFGLYRFKKGFSGEVTEFAGEFDLPLVPALYWMFRTGLPLYRQVRRMLARRRGGGGIGAGAAEGAGVGDIDERRTPAKGDELP
ncbi:MAG: peptidoglycan bridge formation glycyltransferase FemA/FemB family protein [Bacillota bacterium]|nr:peptidoglycan bridge formation glycyltransferase FemA/FemB family protein [Bacillota bacterium]